jgi:hypothetical protein
MKKLVFLLPMIFLLSCTSNSDKKSGNAGMINDSLSGFDLNTMITKTIFDSVPFEKLPYIDSICIESSMPLRKIPLSEINIEFLKLKKLGDFRKYYDQIPDSLFSLVCRLALSRNFYSLVFNYNNSNESMNYVINYDRDFRVIDYIETSYIEWVDISMRSSARIDTSGLIITFSNILGNPGSNKDLYYTLSHEGFFRELLDTQTANKD